MAPDLDSDFEADVAALARQIADLSGRHKARALQSSWWSERMLDWAMSHPSFKTQLFRFVDVFPSTKDDVDVVRHLDEYFAEAEVPRILDLGLALAEHVPFGDAVSASVARRNIARMAAQFIVGATTGDAVDGLHRIWRHGSAFTVDVLGEKTVTDVEADRYAARVGELLDALLEASRGWAPDDHLERDDLGPLPRVNMSIKPTALASRYAPLTCEAGLSEAAGRLRPLLRRARDDGAFVYFDMEHYDVKHLTLELFQRLISEDEFSDLHAGIVVQAYLKDSYHDLRDLVALSAKRARPITVRLVKGAYWDAETVEARAEGWPVPVFEDKAHTDANFERSVRLLHDSHGEVRAAFGSHNLRSIAYAVIYARQLGIPDNGFEIQMLHGMAEPIHAAVRRLGLRLRVYAPVGELVPGMAYLVRRLLENTSNESFVRQRFVERRAVDELIAPPCLASDLPELEPPIRPLVTDPLDPGDYHHEPVAEWRRPGVTRKFAVGVKRLGDEGVGSDVPAWIGGHAVWTTDTIASVDPGCPSRVVARSAACGPDEAERAIEVARRAWAGWRRTAPADRAAVLFRAAEWMRSRRSELAALEIFEAGKPWADADADVCEAIDFCEYYGRHMLRLASGAWPPPESPPGEANSMHYQPRGVGAVIAPWNFPLAIPTGMVAAALVTGNAVLFKPAEQTPATAARLVDALRAGGLPEGVLAFLPGSGETVGAHIVRHPEIAFVVFTGSKAVGLDIISRAAVHQPGQRHVKRVVAEMGGKNAIVVDTDVDLDQAIPIILTSAFRYAGQKCSACSRLVVVDAVHDELMARLVGAASRLCVGHPAGMEVDVGPLIDTEALRRVRSYVGDAPHQGNVVLQREDVPGDGWFVGPTIVTDVAPESPLATDEIFGPVLAVLRAESFEEGIAIANTTDYALTGGVLSRSPHHIAMATRELRAGNVYVNRPITGAVVGRQPFGGHGLSGVGSKAGGPDYLLQFVDPRVVSENTLRQGFAPSAE